jgi:hypothetical protein
MSLSKTRVLKRKDSDLAKELEKQELHRYLSKSITKQAGMNDI